MIKKILKHILESILRAEARIVLAKYKPRIVGITGSVGKTSTKDAVALALSAKYRVGKSSKSYNTDIGIPLAILGCVAGGDSMLLWLRTILEGLAIILFPGEYPEWLVLEIGVDAPGDMVRVASWLALDISVITHIGSTPVHVEFFETPEHVRAEKSRIVDSLKQGGVLLKNADDEILSHVESRRGHRTLTFGYAESADFHAAKIVKKTATHGAIMYPCGLSFDAITDTQTTRIEIGGLAGRQSLYAVLAAFAVAEVAGVPSAESAKALSAYRNPPGRLRALPGIKETLIIDDSYNSSPVAVSLALSVLEAVKTTGRKIAVLGDMLELGRFTISAHESAGAEATKSADMLITVGSRAKFIMSGARVAGLHESALSHFDRAQEAGIALQEILAPGDVVLIKGSQGMRMERIVLEIMAEPERRHELLVRQDDFWSRR